MTGRLRVGVAIPVYNGAQYLREALDSVLAQTRRVDEVVVVDDGSTDQSGVIAASFGSGVVTARQPHAGAGAARNHAASLLSADVLVFLDADDLLTPSSIERRLAVFEARPEVELVFGQLRLFASRGSDGAPEPIGDSRLAPLTAALAVRRHAYARVGGFTAGLHAGEGFDWLLRARELGLVTASVPDLIQWRRVHGANTSSIHRADLTRAVKASLDRRRGKAS